MNISLVCIHVCDKNVCEIRRVAASPPTVLILPKSHATEFFFNFSFFNCLHQRHVFFSFSTLMVIRGDLIVSQGGSKFSTGLYCETFLKLYLFSYSAINPRKLMADRLALCYYVTNSIIHMWLCVIVLFH